MFGPTGFLDIFADSALAPSTYSGSFTVFDEIRQLSVTKDFLINVTAAAPVPEPASMLLLASGLAGLAAFKRKRRGRREP